MMIHNVNLQPQKQAIMLIMAQQWLQSGTVRQEHPRVVDLVVIMVQQETVEAIPGQSGPEVGQ